MAGALLALVSVVPASARDQLTIGISQFPATFHPSFDTMLAKAYILAMVRRPLTAYDSQWHLVCLLCTELPTIENGGARIELRPDGGKGMAVRYTLREAFWGDGVAVGSDDVVLGWQVGRHPQSGVADAELYRRILSIEVIDPRSFVLHLDRVTFDYNAVNDLQLLPAHIEAERFLAAPAEYRNRTAYDRDSTNPGLWNGPYRIGQVSQGSAVVLERNAFWRGRPPAFRRIVVKTLENTAALEANLLAGGIDMIAGELGLPLEQAAALERRHGDRFQVVTTPSLAYEHIDLNLANPVLADRRVRRALLLAIDRATISRQLFDGRQPVAESCVPPLDWVHDPDLAPAGFDPEQSARLLDQAGWHLSDGWRRDEAGRVLGLDLVTTAGNRSRELVAQVLQAEWKRIGIDLRIKTEPPRVLFGDTLTRRAYPAMAMYAWYSAPENVPRSSLHSAMIPNAANGWSGQNYTGFADSAMDRLIDGIEVELDRGKRFELWRRLQRRYADELPALPLFFKADAHVWPRGMTGIVPTGHQDPSSLWVEDWRWE